MQTLQQDYLDLKIKLGLVKIEHCSKEENQKLKQIVEEGAVLPEDVFVMNPLGHKYVRVTDIEVNPQKKEEYIKLKQLNYVRVIRNCIIFLTIVVVIVAILSLFVFPAL